MLAASLVHRPLPVARTTQVIHFACPLFTLATNPGPGPGPGPDFAPGPWAALAMLGVFGTGLAYIINYALIRHEGPTRASVVTYLVTLGAAALNEPRTPNLLTGTTSYSPA